MSIYTKTTGDIRQLAESHHRAEPQLNILPLYQWRLIEYRVDWLPDTIWELLLIMQPL